MQDKTPRELFEGSCTYRIKGTNQYLTLIEAGWAITENNRRAKYFRLTTSGRRRLAEERADWTRLAVAMKKVVGRA